MNEKFHLRGKINKSTQTFISNYIYESCQLLIIQFTKIKVKSRVTLHHTMFLWPLCMLKVPLCWWLVVKCWCEQTRIYMWEVSRVWAGHRNRKHIVPRVHHSPPWLPSAYKQCLALPLHHAQCHAPAPGATPRQAPSVHTVSSVLPGPITRLTCASSGCYSSLWIVLSTVCTFIRYFSLFSK